MKRSAIHVRASDGGNHYLWCDRLPGHVFLATVSEMLKGEALAAAAEMDRSNGGWWLWKGVLDFISAAHGGRPNGLMTSYTIFEDADYLPLMVIDANGNAWLESAAGEQLSDAFAHQIFGKIIAEVLREEPAANLAVALDYLQVDEEI